MMSKQLQQTNDHILAGALGKLAGLHPAGGSVREFLADLDLAHETALRLPFLYTDMIPVYEMHLLVRDLMFPTPRCGTVAMLEEAPGSPFLCPHPKVGHGNIELFVLGLFNRTSGTAGLANWKNTMSHPCFIENECERLEGTLIGCKLASFRRY